MAQRKVSALLVLGVLSCFLPGLAQAQSNAEIEEAINIFNRGKTLHMELRYQEAIAEYRASIKLDSSSPFAYNAMGLALAAVGDLKGALKSFNKALSLNPDLTDVYNNMGMVYAETGQRDKAFEAFGRAVRNPTYLTPEKALYNIGNLYLEDGNAELAMMHFKRAIEKKPTFSLGYRGLGKVQLMLNDPDLAMVEFQKAVEMTEDDTESLFQLASLHQQRGEPVEAAELYRRVVEIDRFSPIGELALARLDALKSGS
jgi:tetratricopeptide (TPR) repeat protein